MRAVRELVYCRKTKQWIEAPAKSNSKGNQMSQLLQMLKREADFIREKYCPDLPPDSLAYSWDCHKDKCPDGYVRVETVVCTHVKQRGKYRGHVHWEKAIKETRRTHFVTLEDHRKWKDIIHNEVASRE